MNELTNNNTKNEMLVNVAFQTENFSEEELQKIKNVSSYEEKLMVIQLLRQYRNDDKLRKEKLENEKKANFKLNLYTGLVIGYLFAIIPISNFIANNLEISISSFIVMLIITLILGFILFVRVMISEFIGVKSKVNGNFVIYKDDNLKITLGTVIVILSVLAFVGKVF